MSGSDLIGASEFEVKEKEQSSSPTPVEKKDPKQWLKEHYPAKGDQRLDVRRLWNDLNYRLNYWGQKEENGDEIVLSSIALKIEWEDGEYKVKIYEKASRMS